MFDVMGATAGVIAGYNQNKIKDIEKEIKDIKKEITNKRYKKGNNKYKA